jgi:hypothetical protein
MTAKKVSIPQLSKQNYKNQEAVLSFCYISRDWGGDGRLMVEM